MAEDRVVIVAWRKDPVCPRKNRFPENASLRFGRHRPSRNDRSLGNRPQAHRRSLHGNRQRAG